MPQAQRPKCRQAGHADDGTPVCGHGEPMYLFGRYWRCAVRIRERNLARYDRDPVYRLSKLLKANAKKRRATLEARKRQLRKEGHVGPLPLEG